MNNSLKNISNGGSSGPFPLNNVFPIVAAYFQVISKVVSGLCSSISVLASLYDLYQAWHTHQAQQRKARVVTHAICASLNAAYLAESIMEKFISNVGLGLLAFSTYVVTLSCSSYLVYSAKKAIEKTESKLDKLYIRHNSINIKTENVENTLILQTEIHTHEIKLSAQQEEYFKSKIDVVYGFISASTSALFVTGFFWPPAFFIGMATLTSSTITQLYDTGHDLKFSRWVVAMANKLVGNNAVENRIPAIVTSALFVPGSGASILRGLPNIPVMKNKNSAADFSVTTSGSDATRYKLMAPVAGVNPIHQQSTTSFCP